MVDSVGSSPSNEAGREVDPFFLMMTAVAMTAIAACAVGVDELMSDDDSCDDDDTTTKKRREESRRQKAKVLKSMKDATKEIAKVVRQTKSVVGQEKKVVGRGKKFNASGARVIRFPERDRHNVAEKLLDKVGNKSAKKYVEDDSPKNMEATSSIPEWIHVKKDNPLDDVKSVLFQA
jgi:septal ring factor EnvC (AmiA/AmiB activator)